MTAALQKPQRITLRQDLVAFVQRLQDQIGRAGGAKQRQRIAHSSLILNRSVFAQMQVCAPGDNRQRFVAGIAAHGCAQCNGMLTALRQKTQVSTVGIIHQKRNAKILAHFGQRCNILHTAEIIRTGDVDAKGPFALLCQTPQSTCQLCSRHRAAAKRTGILRRRPEPLDIKIQQRRRIQQRFVSVARCQQDRTLSGCGRSLQCKAQHRTDALGRALCAVIGMHRAEQPGSVGFALGNDAVSPVQFIRTLYFGNVPRLKAQKALALVAGHMQPGGAGLGVPAHKIHNGRGHAHSQASPSAQALQVEPSSMGTSMPLAASS